MSAVSVERASKAYGATQALRAVDFTLKAGEIHALVGENGAGKSTLIKLLAGVVVPDAGTLRVGSEVVGFGGPADAIAAGIVAIPQELRLVPTMTVAENLVLGRWPTWRGLAIREGQMRAEAQAALDTIGIDLPLRETVRNLGYAERQLIAIAKALRLRPRVLILDEPTAALQHREVAQLHALLHRLRGEGVAILYVTHRLQEIVDIADRCTVMRDGEVVEVARRGTFDVAHLVAGMSGRTLEAGPRAPQSPGAPALVAGGLTLARGEILGVAGLLGSGARETVHRLFGLAGGEPGARVAGLARPLRSPRDAMAAGIGFVPGERAQGLIFGRSVRDNIALPNLRRLGRPWWIGARAGDRLARDLAETLDIRPRDPSTKVEAMSGGNQQKVIFAKWLARGVDILLLDEPTHGIDMPAKARIHQLIIDFAARGGAVLIHSTDIDEITTLCHSVIAVRRGVPAQRLHRSAVTSTQLKEAIGG